MFRSISFVEEQLIDQKAIFLDGTKIEANANKFTFVWKKSIETASRQFNYDELLEGHSCV